MVDRVRTSRSEVVTGSPAVVGWAIVGGWAGGFCSHGSRQDRRVGVSAPVGVRTAAYHASRCALASPPGGWVRLSSRWRSLMGCFAAPATLAACRLLVPPGADDSAKLRSLAAAGFTALCACAAPGGGSRSHPGASAAACPTTQQTPTPQGVRVWIFMRCNGCLCLRFHLPGHLPGIYHFPNKLPRCFTVYTAICSDFPGLQGTRCHKLPRNAARCHIVPRNGIQEVSGSIPLISTKKS